MEENKNDSKHYICHGGCKGVSKDPGLCQAAECAHHGKELTECGCADGEHNNFEVSAS